MRSPRDSEESLSDMSFRKDSGENTTQDNDAENP